MTADSKVMGASAPGSPAFAGKSSAAASQKTLPNRTTTQKTAPQEDADEQEPSQDADSAADRAEADDNATEASFTPAQCLFCNASSQDLESNLSHMSMSHSLFIPGAIDNGALALAVDLEKLVRYMHLVIHTYHECLFCHTQRHSARAVQQHMTGKGHCRVDLEDKGSEFRDFYEPPAEEDEIDGEEALSSEGDEAEVRQTGKHTAPRVHGGSLLLSSGKLLSHRTAPAPKHHRPLAETQKPTRRGLLSADSESPPSEDRTSPSEPSPEGQDTGQALTRPERRAEAAGGGRSALSLALGRMSLGDRAALAHLPAAEQRAVVLRQLKAQDRAHREGRKFWSKVETRGNKTAKR